MTYERQKTDDYLNASCTLYFGAGPTPSVHAEQNEGNKESDIKTVSYRPPKNAKNTVTYRFFVL